MNSLRIKLSIVFLLTINLMTAWAATSTGELLKLAPENSLLVMACSGGDNLKSDFDKTFINKIIQDPQVKTFVDQLMTSLQTGQTIRLNQKISEFFKHIEPLKASRIFNDPLMIGGVCDNFDIEGEMIDGCIYMAMPGGAEKRNQILAMFEYYAKLAAPDMPIKAMKVQGGKAGEITLYDFEEVKLAMGGTNEYTFITFGMADNAVRYIKELASIAAAKPKKVADALKVFDKFTGTSNDIKIAFNVPEYIRMAKKAIATPQIKEELEKDEVGNAVVNAIIETIEPLGAIAIRFGFKGEQMESELIIENFSEFMLADCFKTVDSKTLCVVPNDATEFMIGNLDLQKAIAHIKDFMMEVGAEEEIEDMTKGIAEAEEEIGVNITDSIFKNITGEILLCSKSNPAAGMAGGSAFVMLGVNDCDSIFSTIIKIADIATKETGDSMPVQVVQTEYDGVKVCNLIVPQFAMLGIQPTIVKADNKHLLIATTTQEAVGAVKRMEKSSTEGSILSNAKYQKIMAGSPARLSSIHYIDSEAYWKAANSQFMAFWPMVNMGLSQQGIVLPPMLPNISHLLDGLQGSISWEYIKDGDLMTYGTGDTSNVSLATAGGAALGVSIMMPALSRAKFLAKSTVCTSNLKGIGIATAIYMNDNKGNAPDTIEGLYEVDMTEKSMICPECEEKYVWYGKGLNDSCSPDMILAYCDWHEDLGTHVLFLDSHIETLSDDDFSRTIEENNKKRRAIGLDPIEVYWLEEEMEEVTEF